MGALPEPDRWAGRQPAAGHLPAQGAQGARDGGAKSFKGGSYRGTVTFGRLGRLYGEKVDKRLGKVAISYVLDVNSKGLVTRVRSEYRLDFGILGKTTSTVNTRYTGWGSKVTIKAPPADEVLDVSELGTESDVPQSIPDGSLNSLSAVE
ncbi:hypothetical protein [Nonomuraea salmonea]|uniref:hypothetical protein n=1 Tax=Nonomuraea salmonea TaxID=46181 RepID=UPI002FEC8482